MVWIAGEVDGVAIKQRSVIGTGEWAAVKDRMIALMATQLSDRFDLGDSIADSFADSGYVTGGVCTGGYVRNTETAAVPAQAGSVLNPQNSNWIATGGANYEYRNGVWLVRGSSQYTDAYAPRRISDGTYNNDSSSVAQLSSFPGWWELQNTAAVFAIKEICLYPYYNNAPAYSPTSFQILGSTNGSSWSTLVSRTGETGWVGNTPKVFSVSGSYSYIRFNVSDCPLSYPTIAEMQIIGADIPAIPAHPDPTVITVTPYTPDNTLEKVRVTLMLQDMDNTGALAVGSSSSDLIQAYLSYDGNSTFESALGFSEEPEEFTAGSNIYVFNSDEIDVSAESISSLGLKLQSFDRGSGAPAFRWHAYIIAGKEGA